MGSDRDKIVSKNNPKVTMLSAVYNICVICIVETIKLLSTAIISKKSDSTKKRDADRKIDVTPKLSRRSNSKVVCVQSIKVDPAWLQQISSRQQQQRKEASASSRSSASDSSVRTSSASQKMASRINRVRHQTFPGCHRTLSSSLHQIFSRRRSWPISSSLEVIREEEEI
jgi:hypothetical protein